MNRAVLRAIHEARETRVVGEPVRTTGDGPTGEQPAEGDGPTGVQPAEGDKPAARFSKNQPATTGDGQVVDDGLQRPLTRPAADLSHPAGR